MNDSHLHIDALNLRLPMGFEGRANSIARLTVGELAKQNIDYNVTIKHLSLDNIHLVGNESNRAIARKISSAIAKHISSEDTSVALKSNNNQPKKGGVHVA